MKDIPADIVIGIQVIRPKIADIEGTEAKLREAMRIAEDACFMSHLEESFFKAAVGAVLLELGPEHPDFRNIEHEMKMLQGLSAAASGIPVDFVAMFDEQPGGVKPLGLTKLWRERKGEETCKS